MKGLVVAASAVLALGRPCYAQEPVPVQGFTQESLAEQVELEKKFDQQLDPERIGNWVRRLSARPHHVGSEFGRENVLYIAGLFSEWGFETEIEEFQVLFPTPRRRVLKMVFPSSFEATLEEAPLQEDSTSGQAGEQLPSYNAYSADGDVTAELVYVNYGIPEDYEQLERLGIEVKGKIVLTRYGRSWRGVKPKLAAEKGAVGCLIYSDPRDDGFFQGDVYPKGPYRNEYGTQRGSVADMPVYPGDPLTPGYASVTGAERLKASEAKTIMTIPVLPISYRDALPLLKALEGPVAPPSWRGGLPLTYHIGPGPARVQLQLEFSWDLVPALNVIARIRGFERPNQLIIRGNHHDAWVNGASDPVSGLAAMLEEARALGELMRQGWKPKRSIVFAAWDAEEPGLIGSTEWVEKHADLLAQNAAVYVNSDSNGRGFVSMAGSHSLERFLNEVARSVRDPQTGASVWRRRQALLISQSPMEIGPNIRAQRDLTIGALGSGSDYTPFLQHLGIASLNIGFGGENPGGSYHSIYDSYDHYSRFGDPGFQYGLALAQLAGRTVLRLASADALPFRFQNLAERVDAYVDELRTLVDQERAKGVEDNLRLQEGDEELARDPRKPDFRKGPSGEVPHLNFAPLLNALERLQTSARSCDQLMASSLAGLSPGALEQLDHLLFQTERKLIRREGLPGRPWYRHYVYAPGRYTGYGVKTLPTVRESIEARDWAAAEEEIRVTAGTLMECARQIDRAADLIRTELEHGTGG